MFFEYVFTCAVLVFAMAVLVIWIKRAVWGARPLRPAHGTGKGFCARHPHLCDERDTFYCFFNRDVFRKHR